MTPGCLAKEAFTYQRAEHVTADGPVQTEKPRGLREAQAETGHLAIFGAHALDHHLPLVHDLAVRNEPRLCGLHADPTIAQRGVRCYQENRFGEQL